MIPPTSIDGTDITGATIDGTDVQEITVDGDVVFSAGPTVTPVAYSNLVAWFPFDPSTYGGSFTDDVTALFNPSQSGDSTAHDLSDAGTSPTFQSSGGVTDVNVGPNSGGVDFDDDVLEVFNIGQTFGEITMIGWVNPDNVNVSNDRVHDFGRTTLSGRIRSGNFSLQAYDGSQRITTGRSASVNEWFLVAVAADTSGGTAKMIVQSENDANFNKVTDGHGNLQSFSDDSIAIASKTSKRTGDRLDGQMDDVRWYNKIISDSEFTQIYQNTKP
jgi:hypothetical protein